MEGAQPQRQARRVFVDVSTRSRYWNEAWTDSEQVVEVAIRLIKDQLGDKLPFGVDAEHNYRLVAVERWNNRTHIVFDVFHDDYNPDNAHLPDQNRLPVIRVCLGKMERVSASSPVERAVNDAIRKLHDSFGWGSRPPFSVDHTDGKVPYYANPRSLRYE